MLVNVCLLFIETFLPPPRSARKSKTHITLLPRVVARKEEGSGGETKTKMSNEDFRKLLTEK